jgi:hypothetical protein
MGDCFQVKGFERRCPHTATGSFRGPNATGC